MITKIESGLIDDDYLHDRYTLKISFEKGFMWRVKLYSTGKMTRFHGEGDQFKEKELTPSEYLLVTKALTEGRAV